MIIIIIARAAGDGTICTRTLAHGCNTSHGTTWTRARTGYDCPRARCISRDDERHCAVSIVSVGPENAAFFAFPGNGTGRGRPVPVTLT